MIQGALELARRSLAATYNVISQGGNQFFLAWHWVGVTLVALKAGDLDQADAGVEQAYGLVAAVGNPICEAWAARCSVEVECWRGRARQAWASLTATRRDDGFTIRSPSVGMLLHASTGIVALALGRLGDADRELREALAIARAAGYVAVEGDCLVGLAEIALLRRQADDARILATEIQRCSRILDNAWLDAAAKFVLSRAETDREQAREFCHQALALQSESGYRLDAVMTVEALAQLQARRGNHVDAARLYGAADAERRRLGARFRPLDVLRHRETRAAVATSLEIATLRRALNEGAALSFNDAIAYAGRGRGSRGGRPIIGWASLTSTEKAVARLVSEGLTNREIAGRLLMSTSTVKTHLAHIFGKLAISHRAELASRATQSLHLLD
jgi:DNA-binding CsgD family transcriptional regulator/tetratricopeptide (TPR) repeat protein